MGVLLAFLLVTAPPPASGDANVTATGRQGGGTLQCHACEMENSFTCRGPRICAANELFCSTSVIRLFVRHFMVSRQCVPVCPVPIPAAEGGHHFVLLEPTPLLYVYCCDTNLCNDDSATINDTEGAYFTRSGGPALPCQVTALAVPLALASVSLGPGLP